MKINSINPIVPRNAADPADQFGNLRRAKREIEKRYKAISSELRKYIYGQEREFVNNTATNRQPTKQEKSERALTTNDMWSINKGVMQVNDYVYQLDANKVIEIDSFIESLFNDNLLDNETQYSLNRWWMLSNLDSAYQDAIDNVLTDAVNISPENVVGSELVAQLKALTPEGRMFNPAVMTRLSLMHGRVFNEMKGLTESSKTNLNYTLTQGMLDGNGVQKIAQDVQKRVDISMRRAMTIARTEILNSYRSATRTEVDDLNESVYGESDWEQQLLWFSALAATSRKNHVSRHGLTYTSNEVKEFYSTAGNSANCLCAQSPILVNKKTGEVLQSSLQKKMKEQKQAWQAGKLRSI